MHAQAYIYTVYTLLHLIFRDKEVEYEQNSFTQIKNVQSMCATGYKLQKMISVLSD